MDINASDEKIIKILSKNARQSSEKMAKQIGVSPTTVRRRLKALIRKGVIRNMPLIDTEKLGLTVHAVIGLKVDNSILNETAEKLSSKSEVKWLSSTSSHFDITAIAVFSSVSELNEFKRNLSSDFKGIKDIEILLCLDVKKGRYVTLE